MFLLAVRTQASQQFPSLLGKLQGNCWYRFPRESFLGKTAHVSEFISLLALFWTLKSHGLSFPLYCIIRCEEGYQLATGMSSLSCQSDGTWPKHSIRCIPTPCPIPANFSTPHTIITGKELTPVGGTITLSCPPGLYLQGSVLAECQVRKSSLVSGSNLFG